MERKMACLIGFLCCLVVLESAMGLELTRSDFPSDFVFGSATSAYQVEGAAAEDGRSPSIWDTFVHSGKMLDNSTGDVASDGYHKYKEDVKLMANTGLEAYRFSISWSRLIPGIQIHVMLYHLDLPQVLEDKYQGWLSPRIIEDFTAYADVCFREFGDRVKHWTTLAEPNIFGIGSYDTGLWPPAHCSNPFGFINCTIGNSSVEPYIAVHNLLLAHASVYNLYHTKYHELQGGMVGINVYSFALYPFSDSTADKEAAQRYCDFLLGWIIDPLTFGDYPPVMKKIVGSRLPVFTNHESELLMGAYDFIGMNYYTSLYIMDDSNNTNSGLRDYNADTFAKVSVSKDIRPDGQYKPDYSTAVPDPDGLEYMLKYFKEIYNNPPLYIQENGWGMATNSTVDDKERIDSISGFIGSTLTAIREGANVKGYFLWSFLDLFELLSGYETTFGLYYVDFNSTERTRTPKLSAHWYSNFLRNNGTISTTGLSDESYHAEQ